MSNRLFGSDEHERLIRKLESIAQINDTERRALGALPLRIKRYIEDTDIVQQGDAPGECCLVLEGFVCRYKILGRGQRQIVSFHIPGDVPDFQSLHLKVMDHSLGALTPTLVAFIPHAAFSELMRSHPRLAAAIWRDTLIDASIFREWLSGVGRRSAFERVAHLICEMFVKYEAVGLSRNGSFELPITQAEYGDALGLSTVHVNRSLMALRKQGLIASKGGRTQILDWESLKKAGDFDPMYLHMQPHDLAA
jgi:CRP-like cAMP-binding protein